LEGLYPEGECTEIWENFEKSMNNPFEYDKFIEELRQLKEEQKKSKSQTSINLTDLVAQTTPPNFKSVEK
jgi:hypothetical protein